jgi:hypothetical protein
VRLHRSRKLALLAIPILAAAGWAWSYYRPSGVGRVSTDIQIVESSRGSIVIARFDNSMYGGVGGKRPGWQVSVGDNGELADVATLARMWAGSGFLGFAGGVDPALRPDNKVWVLDSAGAPVEIDAKDLHLLLPRTPSSRQRQWAIVMPWWFVVLIVTAVMCWLWRRTRVRYAAFPVTTFKPGEGVASTAPPPGPPGRQ